MNFDGIEPRVAVLVGILAIVPTVWYAMGRPSNGGFVAAVNVLIVLAALWIAMQPIEPESANGQSAS
ncbi:cytochrome-ba3 oxidase subunit [Halovivax gelatinilyticus]|uniref:cytochrome-ba3 oxidase subunit n=1 Tax=Halovivax gelatinilyticus TaxID=2961597 RepID=UPI0020CA3F31|nr:cytochrome-ba3 oxidase subunit [Halovivax gelatinilyticus]